MRCNYRCNMWCKCKKPARPYPPTPTIYDISAPSTDSVDVVVGMGSIVAFEYSPTEGTPNVTLTIADPSVAHVSEITYTDGLASFTITGDSEGGQTTVTLTNNDDTSQTYDISVTVSAQAVFEPNNKILVDVETPGETRNVKTKARGAGDSYTAKVFAVDAQSTDYVQLEWVQANTPTITFVGLADNEHCRAMFVADTANSIARMIEEFYDEGTLADGFVKFNNTAYGSIVAFFNAPVTQESTAAIQNTLENNAVRFVSPKFNTELSDTQGYVGGQFTLYLYNPEAGGLWRRSPEIASIDQIVDESGDDYNCKVIYNILDAGTVTITRETTDGVSASIQVECLPAPTATLTIDDEASDTTGTVGGSVDVYYTLTGDAGILYSDDPDILSVTSSEDLGEGRRKVTLSVNSAGTTTLTISATGPGGTELDSDSIQIVCSEPVVPYEIENKVYWEFDEENNLFNYYFFTDDKTSDNYVFVSFDPDNLGPSNIGTYAVAGAFADEKYTVNGEDGWTGAPDEYLSNGIFGMSTRDYLRQEMLNEADCQDGDTCCTPYYEGMTSATGVMDSDLFAKCKDFFDVASDETDRNKNRVLRHARTAWIDNTICPKITWTIPEVHVESISQPSQNSVTIVQGELAYVTIGMNPSYVTDVSQDVTLTDDGTVCSTLWTDVHSGVVEISGHTLGSGYVQYYLNEDSGTVYTINVNVVPSIQIDRAQSATTGTVGGQVTIYYTLIGNAGVLYSDDPDITSVNSSEDLGAGRHSVTLDVNSAGTTTFTISAVGSGATVLASDSIQIVCSAPVVPTGFGTVKVNGNTIQTDDISGDGLYAGTAYMEAGVNSYTVLAQITPNNATCTASDFTCEYTYNKSDGTSGIIPLTPTLTYNNGYRLETTLEIPESGLSSGIIVCAYGNDDFVLHVYVYGIPVSEFGSCTVDGEAVTVTEITQGEKWTADLTPTVGTDATILLEIMPSTTTETADMFNYFYTQAGGDPETDATQVYPTVQVVTRNGSKYLQISLEEPQNGWSDWEGGIFEVLYIDYLTDPENPTDRDFRFNINQAITPAPAYEIENKFYWEFDEDYKLHKFYFFTDDSTSSDYVLLTFEEFNSSSATVTPVGAFADAKFTYEFVNNTYQGWRCAFMGGTMENAGFVITLQQLISDEGTPYYDMKFSCTGTMNADCFAKCKTYFDDPLTNPRADSTSIYSYLTNGRSYNPKITWDYPTEE